MTSIAEGLARVKNAPVSLIDHEVVERACREAGHVWRERCLGPARTLEAFVSQIAHGNTAMSHVVRCMGGEFSESAYCQARSRLPVSVVRAATDAFRNRVAQESALTGDGLWRGHRAVLLDGTGVCTADTPELREILGAHSIYEPGCGLPSTAVLTIFDAKTDLLLGMDAAPAQTNDAAHTDKTLPLIRAGDVAVGDRGVCSYVFLSQLVSMGAHGVFRMSGARAMPFPARQGERERNSYNRHRRQEPLLVTLHDENDQVVEIVKPHNRPAHMTPEEFARVPSKMVVRTVRYRVEQPGWRPRQIVLMTDLTDAEKYPAAELAGLYLSRWRIEVNLRHIKRTLGMNRLKCRSIDGVAREFLVFTLVYNAVCAARARSAATRGLDSRRVSFIDTLRSMLMDSAGAPTMLQDPGPLKAWPIRPPRFHPRLLKHGGHSFRVMHAPRAKLLEACKDRTEVQD